MVKLLLDIGNSRCKCAEYVGGVGEADGPDGRLRCHSPVAVGADDVEACLPGDVEADAVAVASVRGDEFNRRLSDAVVSRFKVRPVFVATQRTACGVTTAYRSAASLGVDRFLALIGAWRRVGGACVVADCGTAVTVDALNCNGVHQGGLIMPGLRLLQDSLRRGGAQLPPADAGEEASEPDELFARDTEAAIAGGCRRMFLNAVADTLREMQAQLEDDATLLVTGGDGEMLRAEADIAIEYQPDLVLEGLAALTDSE